MPADNTSVTFRDALSRYLSLEMIRASFDVVPREDLEARVEEEARRWGRKTPTAEMLADIDQELLAEGSYYIVSLSYVVQVGGAVFPHDKSETVYANDTVDRLNTLRRELFAAVANGDDVLPILLEVERTKALTEGNISAPADSGLFIRHDEILTAILARLKKVTPA